MNISASLDEVVMPPPQSFRQKEFQNSQHNLLDILHTTSSIRIIIPMNETIMEPSKTIWQTPPTTLPTCKKAD